MEFIRSVLNETALRLGLGEPFLAISRLTRDGNLGIRANTNGSSKPREVLSKLSSEKPTNGGGPRLSVQLQWRTPTLC